MSYIPQFYLFFALFHAFFVPTFFYWFALICEDSAKFRKIESYAVVPYIAEYELIS